MLSQFQQFVNDLNKTKNWLILGNFLLVVFLISLNNSGLFPLRVGDFLFFAVLTFAIALYRPGWIFLFFIGTIPLEIINLAPANFGLAIRPYQFIGSILVGAVFVRLVTKKLHFKLAKFNLADYLVLTLVVLAFFTALISPEKVAGLKLAVVFASFSLFYFLTRNYIQNISDLKKVIPFFLSSSVVVVFYGLWQNWRFMQDANHFEIMPGRPNSVFAEPDWLGIFLVLLISACYAIIHFTRSKLSNETRKVSTLSIFFFFFLAFSFLLLILSVSRSAWLGALASTFIFLFIALTRLKFNPRHWRWRKTFELKIFILSAFIVSLVSVYAFPLTRFELSNRAKSTAGLQLITASCEKEIELPKSISNISQLTDFECRHINLEEIESEKEDGKFVTEISRPDPNVGIRAEIYAKSWEQIKKNLIFGVGMGNIGPILGQDSAGNFLNASNIFLEMWLGVGILGFLSLSFLFFLILLGGIKNYFFCEDSLVKAFNLFIMVSWFALVVANLFNAGMMLGFLWVWLAIVNLPESSA
jgi:membrane protein YdbS with pleckstrin-like domain